MWRRPVKRIWCSECTGLGHTERNQQKAGERDRENDTGGGCDSQNDG